MAKGIAVAEAPRALRTVEDWAKSKSTDVHLFAGLRCGERWPIGQELTEAAFDAAVARAQNIVCR